MTVKSLGILWKYERAWGLWGAALRLVPLTSPSPPEDCQEAVFHQFLGCGQSTPQPPLNGAVEWKIPYLHLEGTLQPRDIPWLALFPFKCVGCGGRALASLAHPSSHCLWKDWSSSIWRGLAVLFSNQVNQSLSCPCLVCVCVCVCVLDSHMCYSSMKTSLKQSYAKVGICFLLSSWVKAETVYWYNLTTHS